MRWYTKSRWCLGHPDKWNKRMNTADFKTTNNMTKTKPFMIREYWISFSDFDFLRKLGTRIFCFIDVKYLFFSLCNYDIPGNFLFSKECFLPILMWTTLCQFHETVEWHLLYPKHYPNPNPKVWNIENRQHFKFSPKILGICDFDGVFG